MDAGIDTGLQLIIYGWLYVLRSQEEVRNTKV
jgi:hypothetical protein